MRPINFRHLSLIPISASFGVSTFLCVLMSLIYCGAWWTVVTSKYLVSVWPGWIPWSFSSLVGFVNVCVSAVRFLTSFMRLRYCAWIIAMESVKVLLSTKKFQLCNSSGMFHWLGFLGKQTFVLPFLFQLRCCLRYLNLHHWWYYGCLVVCWRNRSILSSTVAIYIGCMKFDAILVMLGQGFRIGGHSWSQWWP